MSLLGLDIGSYSIKYVQVKKGPRGLKVINFGSYPVPDTSPEAADQQKDQVVSETLRKNFQSKSLNNTFLTSAVSGLKVLFKNVQIPKAAQKELAKAVPWACRKDLPFPVESTLFEYKRLDKKGKSSDDKLDVFVVAAQQDLVSNHLALLGAAGITPSKVSTVPVALWNLFHEILKKPGSKCFGVIDIGANSSHIVFINQGHLEFAREVSTGGDDFTEALTGTIFVDGREISFDARRAEAIKRNYGFPDDGSEKNTKEGIPFKEISALIGPVSERLLGEVQRTIDFFKEKFHVGEIEKIYLTGGGALMPNLVQRLSRELNTPVEVFNPFEFLTFKKLREQPRLLAMGPRFAVSIGLALDTDKAFNLLPQQLKGSYGFKYLRRIFRYGFMIAILIMVLLSQNVARQFKKIEAKFTRLSAEYERVKPRREKFLALQNELKRLNSIKAAQKTGLDLNLAAPNHLKAISNLIPRNITLTSFKIAYDKKKIEGTKEQYYTRELLLLTGVAFENNSMEGINLAKF
ncbi:MAG: type IV pilus assembly protein PilM, partial [bacterium]